MNIGMNRIVYCDAFAITISLGTIISATSILIFNSSLLLRILLLFNMMHASHNIISGQATYIIQLFRTREIWGINSLKTGDAYMRQYINHHWFRLLLDAWSAPSHYLNQCWNSINMTLRKHQWNVYRIATILLTKMHLKISYTKWRQFFMASIC